jgi:hypothetical protein
MLDKESYSPARPEARPRPVPRTEAPNGFLSVTVERCPVCRAKVVAKLPGEVVIRNAILRVDRTTGRVSAKCARCKRWVDVPLRYVG